MVKIPILGWRPYTEISGACPPAVPAPAGTLDVDIVIDLQILIEIEACHSLEDNLRKMRFEGSRK